MHHIPHSVNQRPLYTILLSPLLPLSFPPLPCSLPPPLSLPCPACDANQYIYQPPGTPDIMSVCLPCPANSSSATGNVEVCECLAGTGRVSEASGLLDPTEPCTSEQCTALYAVFHACSYNWPTGGWLSSQTVGTLLRCSWHSSEIQFFLERPFPYFNLQPCA